MIPGDNTMEDENFILGDKVRMTPVRKKYPKLKQHT